MDWNGSTSAFVPPSESSFSFLYNYNNYNPYPGMEVTQAALAETPQGSVVHEAMEKMKYGQQEKKKRLTSKQLESLERSFQEEIKLQPDRKMKLSKELGLQPRQIAVWFQNRRTRWKAKQLQHLYDSLKQEFDAILKEKHKLQQEVMKLKDRLREQASRTQISAGYTEIISGEETVESMSEGLRSSNKPQGTSYCQQHAEGNYCSTVEEDYNTVPLPYWAVLPYHP